MNRAQRAIIRNDFRRLLSKIERRYVTKIFSGLEKQLLKVSDDVKFFGIEFARRRAQVIELDGAMILTIRQMHIEVGLLLADKTLRPLLRQPQKKALRSLGFNDAWTRKILEYFNLHLLESAKSIDDTTKKYILKVLERGYNENWSTDEIVKAINDKKYMGSRASLIVRTESVRAAGYGVMVGADSYDYEVQKEWISIPDNRRRHSHMEVEGQVREMGEKFSNGLMFPGDPEGPIKETANCRCTMGIVPKRDENGFLIPKISNIAA